MSGGPSERVVRRAPAKLNLYLEVLGRRSDGYHELLTVMQTIGLCDDVEVCRRPRDPGVARGQADVRLTVRPGGPPVPDDETNLAWQAAARYLQSAALLDELGIDIALTKRIPAGGGLGGGSSDAAHVLVALDELTNAAMHPSSVQQLAAGLGSDVPFFLAGGTCLCTGRGERHEPIDAPANGTVTLLMPPFGTSTPAVYGALATTGTPSPSGLDAGSLASRIAGADAAELRALYRNDLEKAARAAEPRLATWLDSTGMCLTGSGSTLYAPGRHTPDSPPPCEGALISYVSFGSGFP